MVREKAVIKHAFCPHWTTSSLNMHKTLPGLSTQCIHPTRTRVMHVHVFLLGCLVGLDGVTHCLSPQIQIGQMPLWWILLVVWHLDQLDCRGAHQTTMGNPLQDTLSYDRSKKMTWAMPLRIQFQVVCDLLKRNDSKGILGRFTLVLITKIQTFRWIFDGNKIFHLK